MDTKRPDRFKRWMIASFFLIPLVIFGSIGAYYAYFPVKMQVLVRLLAYDKTHYWARVRIYQTGDKAIPYLIEAFASGNPRMRSDSSRVLVWRWPPGHERYFNLDETVRHLVKGLRSKNARVREYSARAFSQLPVSEAMGGWTGHLLIYLSERAKSEPSIAQFLRALRENSVVPELVELLSDPEARVRASAAYALGMIGDESIVPELIRLLSDPEFPVRVSAARSLGRLDAKEAIPHLIKLLSDSSGPVRGMAARSLGGLRAKEVTPQLLTLLSDPDRYVRSSAAEALGVFREGSAVPELIKLLSDPNDMVRVYATRALSQIGRVDAIGPLIACLEEASMRRTGGGEAEQIRKGLIRTLAEALEKMTAQSFGDMHAATSDAQFQAIIQKWLYWWEENKEKYEAGAGSEN